MTISDIVGGPNISDKESGMLVCVRCKHWLITPKRDTPNWSPAIVVRRDGVHYCHRYPQPVAKHGDDFCGEWVFCGDDELMVRNTVLAQALVETPIDAELHNKWRQDNPIGDEK